MPGPRRQGLEGSKLPSVLVVNPLASPHLRPLRNHIRVEVRDLT